MVSTRVVLGLPTKQGFYLAADLFVIGFRILGGLFILLIY